MNDLTLIKMAGDAREKSYSPYSGFRVGAALLCDDGTVFCGTNIENGAFSATVCAERTAFFKAVSEGYKKFKKIAIVGGKVKDISTSCYPCGVCRQVMSEFCDGDFEIITVNNGDIERITLNELLPHSFKLHRG